MAHSVFVSSAADCQFQRFFTKLATFGRSTTTAARNASCGRRGGAAAAASASEAAATARTSKNPMCAGPRDTKTGCCGHLVAIFQRQARGPMR
mmetsp:Transcript_39847/g.68996  ORF Transcript_39847/g.68996 Transcript_39847/m.68996 type:complete len:93 (+) Transcript_39847:248-526(+)